ncbi:MAG: hypothetical protein HY721_10475 [Planctomycetes bacterium]|nr:hypothetical protein [Planctomycetota bacterium]
MDPIALLLEARTAGLRVSSAEGRLVIRGPQSAEGLALRLLEAKPSVLEALQDPRRAAYGAWEQVLGEVATLWDLRAQEARALGRDPAWRDDLADMGNAAAGILAARDAETLARALEAIEGWKAAWLALLT